MASPFGIIPDASATNPSDNFGIMPDAGSGNGPKVIYADEPRYGRRRGNSAYPATQTPLVAGQTNFDNLSRPVSPLQPRNVTPPAPMTPFQAGGAQSLQDSYGLRQNILRAMAQPQAGFTPQQIQEQNLNYLTGTPVQGQANYFTDLRFANDANTRTNAMNQAQIGAVGSEAALNNANAQFRQGMITPMQNQLASQAGLNNAQANQITTMTPLNAQSANIANTARAMAIPYIPGQQQAQINAATAAAQGNTHTMDSLSRENQQLRQLLSRYQNTAAPKAPKVDAVDQALGVSPTAPAAASPPPAQPATAPPAAQPAKPATPSQADIDFTARKYGITPDEVRRRLGM